MPSHLASAAQRLRDRDRDHDHDRAPDARHVSASHSGDSTPESFLNEAANATDGWSEKYGGTLGVIALCGELQQKLAAQSEAIAAIRVAAIRERLRTRSGREVAASLGVTSAAIFKAVKADTWEDARW
ncbi:hypothetical protein [Brachybacterium kimchii]|uniref:Uncharacterized protein n=1 Tax=Brachybacterium kimchii TaxID=2942909 RepID=A0ABY4NDL7_9MICO|nr:hypothetical protein [Brachybacterium kimchii]UQN31778.1 hypothetical protein M4486_19505 [Brachybacterium kimchii]